MAIGIDPSVDIFAFVHAYQNVALISNVALTADVAVFASYCGDDVDEIGEDGDAIV